MYHPEIILLDPKTHDFYLIFMQFSREKLSIYLITFLEFMGRDQLLNSPRTPPHT